MLAIIFAALLVGLGIAHWVVTIRYAAKVDDLKAEIENLKQAITRDG